MAPLRLVFAVRSSPTHVRPRDSHWADSPAGTEKGDKGSGVRQRTQDQSERSSRGGWVSNLTFDDRNDLQEEQRKLVFLGGVESEAHSTPAYAWTPCMKTC